jgi:hypothetical protein
MRSDTGLERVNINSNNSFVHIAEKGPLLLPPLLLHRERFSETDLLTCDVVQVKEAAYSITHNYFKYFTEFS